MTNTTDGVRMYYFYDLPHFDGGPIWQTVTFHLADSIPISVVKQWHDEFKQLPSDLRSKMRFHRSERHLDCGYGSSWLKIPEVASVVENALLYYAGQRYELDSWVVMPNHVHTLFQPFDGWRLETIVHSWKSYTANKANKILHRQGTFWQVGYYDRFIRDEAHFIKVREYIAENPVKAGLCRRPEDWLYSSARRRVKLKENTVVSPSSK